MEKVESTQEQFDDVSRGKKTKGKYIVPIYILDMIKERINELKGKTGKTISVITQEQISLPMFLLNSNIAWDEKKGKKIYFILN